MVSRAAVAEALQSGRWSIFPERIGQAGREAVCTAEGIAVMQFIDQLDRVA